MFMANCFQGIKFNTDTRIPGIDIDTRGYCFNRTSSRNLLTMDG